MGVRHSGPERCVRALAGRRRHHGREGDGRGDRRLITPAIDQIIVYIKNNELGFLALEKGGANREKEKTQVALTGMELEVSK